MFWQILPKDANKLIPAFVGRKDYGYSLWACCSKNSTTSKHSQAQCNKTSIRDYIYPVLAYLHCCDSQNYNNVKSFSSHTKLLGVSVTQGAPVSYDTTRLQPSHHASLLVIPSGFKSGMEARAFRYRALFLLEKSSSFRLRGRHPLLALSQDGFC